MPNFIFPLLYRNRTLQNHVVQTIIANDNVLVTAGQHGDIVIWMQDLNPRIVIYPNLSNAYGKLLTMNLVRMSFLNILDRAEECILTIHEDKRIRIFDCNDGRCVAISAHESAGPVQYCIPLSSNNCRFLMLGMQNGVSLFDLWKMRSVKQYDCKLRSSCQIDPNTVCILDKDNCLHLINLSPLNNERYLNYKLYKKKRDSIKQDFKELKLCDGLRKLKIEGLLSNRIRHMSFNQQFQHLTILMHRQLYLVFEIYDTPWIMCISQSKNNQKFSMVHYSQDHLYITTRNGSVLGLEYKDIIYLLSILKEQSDFVYGFKEFQFTKIAGSRFSRLQINFQELISGSEVQKELNGIFILNHLVYQYKNQCLCKYNLKDATLDMSLIRIEQPDSDIKFNGFQWSFNTFSDLIKIETLRLGCKQKEAFDFTKSYNEDLVWNLGQMTSSQFKTKYLPYINIETQITSAFISVSEESQIYWFGCSNSTIFGFPTTYSSKSYFIYRIKLDEKAVTFIYQKGKCLIASSESGQFIILDYSQVFNERMGEQQVEFIDLEPSQRIYFPSYAKKTIRIHKLENESYEEVQTTNQSQKFQKIAILMENNVILIINLQDGGVQLKLHGINQQVLGLYYEDQGDQWFVVVQGGESLVFDYKGRYLRTLMIEQYHSLFQVEKKLNKVKEKMISHHHLSEFKKEFNKSISKVYQFLEFQQRNNYIKMQSPYPSLYEVGGQFKQWQFEAEQAAKMLYLIDHNSVKNNMRMCKFVETSIGELEWWDLKKSGDNHNQNRLFLILHPWEADAQLSTQLDQILNYQKPTFSPLIGVQSMGYCVSFALSRGWDVSPHFTTQRAMSLMHFYLSCLSKEAQVFNQLMIQTVELLTKKKQSLDVNFKPLDLFLLAQYTIDESNEVMNAACNLILSQIRKSDQDMHEQHKLIRELLDLNKEQQGHTFSNVEVILLILESYLTGMCQTLAQSEDQKRRVIQGLHLKNCIVNPHLCAPLLKVFVDVQQHFRNSYNPSDIFKNLFFIFFHYNTVIDYSEILTQGGQQMQLINLLKEISKQSEEMKKRMRQLTAKSIIQVAIAAPLEFTKILNKDIVNLETHFLYPSSIIEIIRYYIKSQHNNIHKLLPSLMDIILKSLDPNNPNLRKVCHRSATYALQTICKTFKCVCFHQQTQKIAIGDTQIIIYDLRTAVKWRVLDGHSGQVNCLEFDHTGKQLASFSDADWKVKIWKVGSTGFFGAIIGIQGKAAKDTSVKYQPLNHPQMQWSQDDSKVYLMSNGQSIVQLQV
ncbi:unnamed protein product (macronuclear) [Paramecium tetraurelia]|uniref:Uncharacterized protein n=1 Tax=Paramecium tetraurelia TaxID=5888 RepID=A0BVU7_PARTE|nr:uncharacterized protein GSPATT00032516001 [Paramecium tetraurelia]CAK62664.1 unnamed protein product [Paramecium tetraurelia]|eukprot:XP_001430062.1 hypothetical protein (macronuclear) [Paramecium tetraurelia strain d4-2]